MNKESELIKMAVLKQMPPPHPSGVDPRGDEIKIKNILNDTAKWGTDYKCTHDWNEYEKWDIEGSNQEGMKARYEVKSRPVDKSEYPTWIIDMYKVDHMLGAYPYDCNYFVNSCGGKYHVYDMQYIRNECNHKKGVWSWMESGRREPRDFYYIPKDMFLIELKTGEVGKGSEHNNIFTDE